MRARVGAPDLLTVVGRAVRPPVREWRFWAIQAIVVVLAALHLLVDMHSSVETGAFPTGVPVALLIIPVSYAALRFGLAGSAATAVWATLLWLPDLLLPHEQGHAGNDLIELALVDLVAFIFGQKIETERLAHARVEQATAERLSVEAGYRQLFEANRAPILVLDARGAVHDANPAATALFGREAIGVSVATLLGAEVPLETLGGRVLGLADGRDYRVGVAALPVGTDGASTQVILHDVTEERSEGRRATRYAALVVAAEEDQRRQLARELHDEPLQLFLHLARRLEHLSAATGVPEPVAAGLGEARSQALQAATRLRNLARDLRPPVLDQLGLAAALSSFLADVEEETGLVTDFEVTGEKARLAPEVELGAFRIIQEAVRNTVRHAGARHVQVTVGFEADELAITVTDDGRGFVREGGAERTSARLGLLGMGERATLLGGRLDVRSMPGEGTVVRATLPRTAPAGRTGL